MKLDDWQFDTQGRITTPGKFEGEMLYMPYFWGCFVDGCAVDNESDGSIRVDVIEDDKNALRAALDWERNPLRKQGIERAIRILSRKTTLSFVQSDDGFIIERRAR